MTRTRLCVGVGCLDRGLPVMGGRLCTRCRDRLAADLRALPRLYAACEEILGGGRANPREPRSGGPNTNMPFNTVAFELRASISDVLCSWAGLVVEQRHARVPRRTVPALAEFLLRHADWLARHEAADDFSAEMAELVRRARRLTSEEPVRRLSLGECIEPGCAGALHALIRPDTPEKPTEIRCAEHAGHRWSEREWFRLRRRMARNETSDGDDQQPRWLSAMDISRLWRVPAGSVYRLASEGRWRRHTRGRCTYYHEEDVLTTLDARRARSN